MADEPIRTLIVDDEPLARDGLRVLLERSSEIEIVGECSNGKDALLTIRAELPDLVLLDVQMPEMSGFEVLEKLAPEQIPAVIFITAFDRYALRAFEVHALDYLLKPFDDERFEGALSHAVTQIRQQRSRRLGEKLLAVVEDFKELAKGGGAAADGEMRYIGRIAVRSGGRVYFLKVDEIEWFEAADYYVKLHVGGKQHLIRETMNHLESQLDPQRFLRLHRSTIVNLDRVQELRSDGDGDHVLLEDGTRLRVSRGGREKLHAALSRGR